ncbi:MAG: hypothetical protein ACR2H1_06995 [Limisphaerales bacterium]
MKKIFVILLALNMVAEVHAFTTISSTTISNSAYGANIGWVNFYADGTNGAVIGNFVCSGYIYGANVGWINLGSGSALNGIRYQNNATNDFGVNNDGLGNLSGYAYGANIGWINFETNGNPKVNLQTGVLSGYAYGANVGWISLSNFFAVVKTDSLFPGTDSDGDGIPDAWERSIAGNLTTLTGTGDADLDGSSDVQEYLADTNPLNPNDNLRITFFSHSPTLNTFTWTSVPSRNYKLQRRDDLNLGFPWLDITGTMVPDSGATTTRSVSDSPVPNRFFRVGALLPLSP